MIERFKRFRARLDALSVPDRRRTDGVLQWIADNKAAMIAFNLFLWLLFRGVQLKLKIYRGLQRLGWYRNELEDEATLGLRTGEAFPPRPLRERPRVLLVIEETIPQCFRYRVQQKLDQFERLGWTAEWISWRNAVRAKERMHFFDIVIFYRVPGFPEVLQAIKYANAINRVVIYDTDDLVFDRERLAEKFTGETGQLPEHEYQAMLDGAELYSAALKLCPYALASTPALARAMRAVVGEDRCHVLPNALDADVFKVLDGPLAARDESIVQIFYGSGTRTHDEDFALVAGALATVMQKYPEARLVLVGYLTLPAELEPLKGRITHLPLMEFDAYLVALRYADINIAPLEPGIFADCKSEIKWLEAAAFGIPSVVSPTETYDRCITPGENGYIAASSEEWVAHLSALIEDPELRRRIGRRADEVARAEYGRQAMAERMRSIVDAIQRHALARGQLYDSPRRKRVLVANAFYPPEMIGGATVVVMRSVEELRRRHGEDIDVLVLKSDLVGTAPYQIKEYVYNGVNVITLGVPSSRDTERQYRDEYMLDVFDELLDAFRPDLIHFHAMQRLTGTLVECALRKQTPYIVTVHDAWWISKHQFLLDEHGELVDERQLDPVVAARTADDAGEAVKRASYLSGMLRRADRVLAVSEYQAGIYRRNGIDNVLVNKNGVPPVEPLPWRRAEGARLRVGYVGGICDHKGYYLLKERVEAQPLQRLQIVLIDIDIDDPEHRAESRWGDTPVETWGRQPPERMDEFYAAIDVLVAPSIWPESFGLVTREAALRGIWVVAAEAGGLAEDVIPERTGFRFPMRDGKALSGILERLNREADYFLATPPDVDASRRQITGLAEQVDELVAIYRQHAAGGPDTEVEPGAARLGTNTEAS